jgi:hypothetical protein
VRLESRDGAAVDLRVLRRQRTELRGRRPEDDWAADWLLVRGELRVPGEPPWTFREPCLTPWEGRRLGSWLRAVAAGPPAVSPGDTLRFAEPALSLALDAVREDRRLVRVHLAGAAAPLGSGALGVLLDVGADGLQRAAGEWSADLDGMHPGARP